MTLTFNIIYTPGTVPFLSPLISTLLQHCDYNFRLVANGCLLPEQKWLQHLCAKNLRLDYLRYPSSTMVDHGEVLNHLQAMTTDPYFCFMDSDICATDRLHDDVQRDMLNGRSVFSASPIWMTFDQGVLPDDFQMISGVHHSTESGVCLGSTYFAIYHNDSVTACRQETGIGFQTYNTSEIPALAKRRLEAHGWLKSGGYDTAKVLNLLLNANGHDLHYSDNDSIVHIGGFSFLSGATESRTRIARSFPRPIRRLLTTAQNISHRRAAWRDLGSLARHEKQAIVNRRLKQRDPVRRYFRELLTAIACGHQRPEAPSIGIKEIDDRIAGATELIVKTIVAAKLPIAA